MAPYYALLLVCAALGAGAAASPARSNKWFQPYLAAQPLPITKVYVKYDLTTPNIIAKYGYPSEAHTVSTSDGYLLTLHRIPNPGKQVVYLQHGVLSSSADWVVLGPQKALAFILYDAGYDVWMGNFRGNTYSRAHATLTPKDKNFWNFSWHEMGMHDIPAMIDYILKNTQQSKLVYVGHSQGTTAFFVMASMRPEYNEKVSAFVAMAPVAFLGHVGSLPLKIISKAVNELEFISNAIGMYEFLPSSELLSAITSRLCSDSSIVQAVCTNTLFLIAGYDSEELDTEKLPDIMQNVPAGASTKQLLHFGQLINSDTFRQYDYGFFGNLGRYKRFSPPEYPLEKISTRVFLHYADNDLLAVPQGVKRLHERLPNVKLVRRVPNSAFNHLDFLYARDGRPLLYDDVLTSIQEVTASHE